jgi:outer membrane protein OmpA-like peptidoglycan-associated protein
MKKLVTWISKASQQFRSTVSLGWRSLLDRLPELVGKVRSKFSEIKPSNWSWDAIKESLNKLAQLITGLFCKDKTSNQQNQAVNTRTGLIADLNQKYLKLPEPFAGFLKPFIITISLIAAYAVLGFYIVPAVLKAKIPSIIQVETGRKASVVNIEFNPFALIASIQSFKILEKNGKSFVDFDNFTVDVNGFQSIKQLALVIDEVALKKPTVHLAKLKNGKFNFEDMAKPKKKEEPKKPDDGKMFPLSIVKLSIKDGKLFWDDKHFAKPVSEEISPINLNISNLSTDAKTKAKLDFNLALKSGGKLDWKANVGVNPIFSEGGIKLDKVQLQKVLALALSDTAAIDLKGIELFNLDYKVSQDKKDLKVTIKKTKFELKDFQFADKSASKMLLKTPSFTVETDAVITVAKNNLDVAIKKAKLDSRDLQFSNQLPEPISVVIPTFNHETDIKVTQVKEGLKIIANNAKISIKNVRFVGLNQGKVEAKLADIALETAYQLGLLGKDKTLDANITKGKFDLHDLQVSEKGEPKTLVKIPAFGLNGIGVNLKNQEVVVDSVTGKDAEVQAWLNKDGAVNYQTLFAATKATVEPEKASEPKNNFSTARTVDYTEATPSPTPKTAPIAAQPPKKDWLIKVNNLALDNFALTFEDKTLKKPVVMTASPINLKLNNFVSKLDTKLPFQLDIGINKTGSIKLNGDAVIAPLVAKIDVDVRNIDLDTFQPYVDKFARLDVLDGKFNINGKLAVQQPKDKPLDVKFKGNSGIASLLTRDHIQSKDFVKWDNLTLKDLDIDLLANRYSAALLLIEKPYAKVTIRKDKTINFSDIMIPEKGAAGKSVKPVKSVKVAHSKTSQNTKPIFKLDKVKIVDGSSDFADLSLILPFAAQIKSLDGGAHGISSDQKSSIKVDLKGNAYDLAPVDIKGEISPYQGNFDVDLKFDGMPMPLVTPYMVQFAGYKIEKGKLTMGLHYQVEKGQLKASNNILIDQLELGEKVDNPNAVSLPLGLAIALLKDSDGKIKLDVPLTGSLEDPKFSIGAIVVDALVNVLTKIVTSPFNAIASLAGSDEDLSTVSFAPGKDALDAKETGKLDGVAKALKEKPVLNIEVKGAAFEEQDWPILREEALFDQLKKIKAAELSEDAGKKVRAEYVELTEDDYNDLLADAFIKQFPTLGEKNLLGTPKLIGSEGDFFKVAKQKMSEIIKPDPKRLKDLASERSQAIAKYIVQKGGVPNERVFILDSALDPKREGKAITSALSLKAN